MIVLPKSTHEERIIENFNISIAVIIVTVLNQLLVRSGREEQAMLTTIAGLIVVLVVIVKEVSGLFTMIKTMFGF